MNATANEEDAPEDFGNLLLHCPSRSRYDALLVSQSMCLAFNDDIEPEEAPASESGSVGSESRVEHNEPFMATLTLQHISQLAARSGRGGRQWTVVSTALPPIEEL